MPIKNLLLPIFMYNIKQLSIIIRINYNYYAWKSQIFNQASSKQIILIQMNREKVNVRKRVVHI